MLYSTPDSKRTDSGYITVDGNWRITSCDATASRLLDVSSADILGQAWTQAFSHDNQLRDISKELDAIVATGDSFPLQLTINSSAATKPADVRLEIIPVLDSRGEILGALLNVFEVHANLRTSKIDLTAMAGHSLPANISDVPFLDHKNTVIAGVESFRDDINRLHTAVILDSVADGVFTVDHEWRITSFNLAAENITGWQREKAIGRYCSDVFHSSLCGKNCAIAESLYTGKAVANRSITIENYGGKCCPVSISAAPLIDLEGNVVGGVETFRDLRVENTLRRQLMKNYTFDTIISKSPAMHRLFQIMPEIALSESTVLILGESGTGKELIARAVFNGSSRTAAPFITVNCGALPETLLESELFGYMAGAFTDARKDKQGRFAAAEGGTLFLDEIGDIPPSVQVKLLRVLEQKVYEPLGSNTPITADVRIIAATNKDLGQLAQSGEFRDDLFYRLNVVNISLPPLRQRLEDIPLLIEHFIEKFRAEKQKDITGVSEAVMQTLMRHSYPGNIRELENIIEYGFILCPGGNIQQDHLPDSFHGDQQLSTEQLPATAGGVTLADLEKQAILMALERNGGKKMITCRELGISKDTLRRKLQSYSH